MSQTYSSREFNQKTSEAKNLAEKHPVFIKTRGKTTHVLLNIEEYQRLKGEKKNILEMLSSLGNKEEYFEFEPPKLGKMDLKPEEF